MRLCSQLVGQLQPLVRLAAECWTFLQEQLTHVLMASFCSLLDLTQQHTHVND